MTWQTKKLGEVCTIKGRIGYRGYTKQDLVKKGEGAISLSPSNIIHNKINFNKCTYISWFKYDESPEIQIKNGDIIYCKTASIGKIALIEDLPEKTTINPQFVVLKDLKCLNKYLYFFMISENFKTQVRGIIGGTAVPTLSQANLGNLELPFPPLSEQKRIVKKLDEVFEKVAKAKENAEKNLQNSKELFESYLQNVFANPGKNWEETSLGDAYDVRDGTHDSPRYQKEGFALVTSKNLKRDLLNFDKIKYISEKDYRKINDRSKVDKGDILFAMIGTIGNPVVVEVDPDFAIKNVALFKVPKQQNAYFLKYFLDSKFVIDKMMNEAKGTTQKFVGLGYLRSFKIKLPPILEQKMIVKKLDTLSTETRKLEKIYSQKLAGLEELRKSVLQQAFTGKP